MMHKESPDKIDIQKNIQKKNHKSLDIALKINELFLNRWAKERNFQPEINFYTTNRRIF